MDKNTPSQPRTHLETEEFIHELQVRQIELELENEELQRIILSDISDLKLAQEALSQSEEYFRSFVENVNDVVFSISPDAVFKYVSPNWKELFGYELDETIGRSVVPFIHPDDTSTCFASLQSLLATGDRQQNIEYRVLHKNGKYISYSANASRLQDPISGEVSYLGIGRDITERKRSEEQLCRLNRSLMAIGDCSMALFDARDEVELLNAICRIAVETGGYRMAWVGYADHETKAVCPVAQSGFEDGYLNTIQITWLRKEYEQSPGMTAVRTAQPCLVRDIETDPIFAPWRVEAGKRGYSSMLVLPLKTDDQVFGVLSIYSASLNAFDAEEVELLTKLAGNLSFGISALRTRRALLEMEKAVKKSIMEQLIHSQKVESIGQLAGGLAHDLNNILTVVNGYATLAQLGREEDDTQVKYLDEIIKASTRASSLTQSLLVYSRKQEMNQQKQNLNSLITTVASFIDRIIHDNIVFSISLHDDPLAVDVDDVQIEQVLLNLASNARDAMPDGGEFSIKTTAEEMDEEFIAIHGFGTVGCYAVITVADSGHGMDAETKRKVFDPFFTTKEVGKGTGLGLAMVMSIIKQHGGFIDLQSEPESGSVFKLYLPLLASSEVVASEEMHDTRLVRGSGTILLAEDDSGTLQLLDELLTRTGYTVITAVDGEDAVKKFTAHKEEIQLVVSDMIMPKMSGRRVYDEIRAIYSGVKFIFLSGHSKDIIEREGGFCDGIEVIRKPVMPFDLLVKVGEAINKP